MDADKTVFIPKSGEKITRKDGILFISYSTLAKEGKPKYDAVGHEIAPAQSRLDQVIDWLGSDFDGVICFDESHNMANATETRGARGIKDPSKKAIAGIRLQNVLPNARIVTASATAATEVENLAYGERLGLWGEGTAFASKMDFIQSIKSGGVAAMEVVASNLKSMGRMVARTLAYEVPGKPDQTVTYRTLEHKITANDTEVYNKLAGAWQIVLENIDAAIEETGGGSVARRNASGQFWGAHQRFFNQILTSLPTPTFIKDMEAQLKADNSCVIQLFNTNEALMDRRLAQAEEAGLDLEDVDLTPRDMLIQFLQRSFPVNAWEDYWDAETDSTQKRLARDSEGEIVQDPLAVARREDLIKTVAGLPVPETIIERIINHFGSDSVAEMTGRKRRLARQPDGSVKLQRLTPASKKKDVQSFMDKKKRILIFSNAGGTGVGYHSDLSAINQQKRAHYLAQPGWIASKAIQGFGRSHRTHQRIAPENILITTNIAAHKRFFSSIARRLDQVGALTKGERKTASQGLFSAEMNLENEYADLALRVLFNDLQNGTITLAEDLGPREVFKQMGFGDIDDYEGDAFAAQNMTMTKFLNRLLSMEIDAQNTLFEAFIQRLEAQIQYAVDQGTYETGIETLRADKIKKVSEQNIDIPVGKAKYTELKLTYPTKLTKYEDLPVSGTSRFLRNKRSGKFYFFRPGVDVTEPSGAIRRRVIRLSPTATVPTYMNTSDVSEEKYEKITRGTKKLWNAGQKDAPKTYTTHIHVVSGTLLPIWDRLPGEVPKVIRVKTDEGEVLLGRTIPSSKLDQTKRALRLGIGKPTEVTSGQALNALLENDATLVLANNWTIKTRTVSGEDRIEVAGPTGSDINMLEGFGAFTEIIGYKTRVFIPLDRAEEIIKRVIKNKPVVEIQGRRGEALPSNIINRLLENEKGSSEFINDLSRVGADVMRRGYTKFKDFSAEMKRVTGRAWDKVKSLIRKAYFAAKKILKSERGAVEIGKPKPKPEVGREVISKDGTTVDWNKSMTLLEQKVFGTYKKDGSFDKWRTRA
ncbi:MAG: strawberry notch C-terminal domain-containing protein, partial [Proteobacteria bacterium]|nr:strawberry notch C-terminal domain-containing protein [Pseudomonadota bacterium]